MTDAEHLILKNQILMMRVLMALADQRTGLQKDLHDQIDATTTVADPAVDLDKITGMW